MDCVFPSPLWQNNQSGILSAVENLADGYIVLRMADASPVFPASDIFYNIYVNEDVNELFSFPSLITTSSTVSVPKLSISLSDYISARVSQIGVSNILNASNLLQINDNVYSLPSPGTLVEPLLLADGYIAVDNSSGLPETDGYIAIEQEIIMYSSILPGHTVDGYDALVIFDRDPFLCNELLEYPAGTAFSVWKGFESGDTKRVKAAPTCFVPQPTWPEEIGIRSVEDLGIGSSVKITTFDATVPAGFSQRYFNLYTSNSLVGLLRSEPVAWTTQTSFVVPDNVIGHNVYFGIKAFYQIENISVGGWEILSPNTYAYPSPTEIDGYLEINQLGDINVLSTDGFPLSGYLRINSEILQYNGISSTSFNIVKRDIFNIGLSQQYLPGTGVRFFKGVEDGNRCYYRTVPSWDAMNTVPRLDLPDGYNGYLADGYNGAAYNQDQDGYRAYQDDDINEDYSDFETARSDDVLTGRCSYHRENWDDLFSRNQCGTYSGGRQNRVIPGVNNGNPVPVGGGIDVWGHATRTEEDLLGKTGTPFVLLRRKWTGKKCPILSLRSEHPRARCFSCYGTTFDGGYDRHFNERAVRMGQENPHGFIMIRLDPYDNDIELHQSEGLKQTDVINGWTISIPHIKDRDILIRYYFNIETQQYEEEFRYEVLKVNRNTLLFGQLGKQGLTLRRLDKTREIYKYPNPLAPLSGIPPLPGIVGEP
jgi:hypothetical protein